MLSLQNYSVFCSGHMEPSEMGIFLNKSWTPQLRDQTLCFFAWDGFFSAAATKGWEWCNHNAGLPECTAALRDLKLLVGSGDLDFTKGMDSLDKRVWKISFRQCITLCEHGQLKGWRKPHFQVAVAKSWISTHCNSMANVKKSLPIFRNKPWRPQLRDQTYVSLHDTQIRNLPQRSGIFSKRNASIMRSWWSVLSLSATLSFW